MFPVEFIVKGIPISAQASSSSKATWKQKVASAASRAVGTGAHISQEQNLRIIITHYYEGNTPDLDNIIKPIQDALKHVIYEDDNQICDTRSRKKNINGSYKIRGQPSLILHAFAENEEFVHIKIEKDTQTGELS